MKKLLIILSAVVIASSMAFSVTAFNPKKETCKQACKEALKKCEKETKGNEVKMAACKAAYEECLADCEKNN